MGGEIGALIYLGKALAELGAVLVGLFVAPGQPAAKPPEPVPVLAPAPSPGRAVYPEDAIAAPSPQEP